MKNLRTITFEEKEAYYRKKLGGPSAIRHIDGDGTVRGYTEEEWNDYVRGLAHPDQETVDWSYIGKRVNAYPKTDEQLGDIWKVFAYLKANGTDLGPEGNAMVDLIARIKETFPVVDYDPETYTTPE